jgi:aspartyl-tRNA(Asn)/glutamyl-tRNA(Gln) amidotransferase subunit B
MRYQPVIGLEIHIELKTKSKMFCGCPNDPEAKEPNVHICPICTGQPGALPVINQKGVEYTLKTALALNCQIPEFSKFDRKNYFYPDLPKGYQISQYDKPLSLNGFLEIDGHRVRIRRIHLEEDTGKLIHPAGVDYSLIDFNRAGLPLMELVTEPDIVSPQEARKFAQELQLILRYLGVSDADMEKGQMRVEANISLQKDQKTGVKVEIKNLNSFRSVERALEYEIQRQKDLLESGEKVIQETRGWDEAKQKTFSQRTKEEAEDYRYFPEPDLPPLKVSSFKFQVSRELPELPQAKRQRFFQEYKLPQKDIEILVADKDLADYFEQVCSEFAQTEEADKKLPLEKLYKLATNYLLTEVPRLTDKIQDPRYKIREKIMPENFAEFIVLIKQGEISSSAAQTVLKEMFTTGADPSHIIEAKGLKQVSDEAELTKVVEQVIKDNPGPVKDYCSGKENALQFLVGQVMKATQGKANPQIVSGILRKRLK